MKTVLNVHNFDIAAQPLFLGEDMGLQRYDICKYPIFDQLYKKQQEFMWRPSEINLINDRTQYEKLSETERFIFNENLRFQTMGDSMLSRTIDTLKRHVTNTQLEAAMAVWAFMECVHSESYTWILQNITNTPSEFFDSILQSKEIVDRSTTLRSTFDSLLGEDKDIQDAIFKTVMMLQIAEGIFFYNSFACSFWYGSRGIMRGNADIIRLIARDENAVSPDTEVMTKRGWVKFPDLRNEEILQYTKEGMLEWITPNKIIEKDYSGNMNYFRNLTGQIDMAVTDGHRVVYRHIKTGEIRESLAENFRPNQEKQIPVAGKLNGHDVVLSDYERLLIAIQADGTVDSRAKEIGKINNSNVVFFSFSKERKIKRLEYLLNRLDFEYTKSDKDKYGKYHFRVKIPIEYTISKEFDWIDFGNIGLVWCQEFIEELMNWDGHVRNDTGSYYYSSIVEGNVKVAQAIACLCGYRTYTYIQEDDRKDSYSNIHRLSILKHKDSIDCQSIAKACYSEYYNGKVYCVNVPSGMFLARRNGQTFITGNCHVSITNSIIKIWQKHPSEGFQDILNKNTDLIYEMFRAAVDHEKQWAAHLFHKGSLIGLNELILSQYIEWLANTRLANLGYKKLYDQKTNPIGGWINEYTDSSKSASMPQEQEIISYKKNAQDTTIDFNSLQGLL